MAILQESGSYFLANINNSVCPASPIFTHTCSSKAITISTLLPFPSPNVKTLCTFYFLHTCCREVRTLSHPINKNRNRPACSIFFILVVFLFCQFSQYTNFYHQSQNPECSVLIFQIAKKKARHFLSCPAFLSYQSFQMLLLKCRFVDVPSGFLHVLLQPTCKVCRILHGYDRICLW